MSQIYSGNVAGLVARQDVEVQVPLTGDTAAADSVSTGLKKLADLLQYLQDHAGLIDTASTWSALQTLSAGLTSGGKILMSDGNPAVGVAQSNFLSASNLIKAYGTASTDGVGGATLSAAHGFNIASVQVIAGSPGYLKFNLAQAFPSAGAWFPFFYSPNYLVNVTVTAKNAGDVTVSCYDCSTGTPFDMDAVALDVSMIALGWM